MRRSRMSRKEGRNEGGKGGLTNSGDISTSMRATSDTLSIAVGSSNFRQ